MLGAPSEKSSKTRFLNGGGFLCNSSALFLPLLKAGKNLRVNFLDTSIRLIMVRLRLGHV